MDMKTLILFIGWLLSVLAICRFFYMTSERREGGHGDEN